MATCNEINNTNIEDQREAPINEDILETIFSYVPLIHLLPASLVSRAWKRALSTSLRHVNPIKPWLMLHIQNPRALHVTTTFAYDPRSRTWFQIHAPHPNHASTLRASNSTFLYTLSSSEFAFSIDPLHLHWHYACPPRVSRTDPIVARVGPLIVVAGGACEFEDDPLAVEAYDTESRAWTRCQSMPAILKDSSASTWLSATVTGEKMYVTEKNSGVTYSLDCNTMGWQGPLEVRPNLSVFHCVTGAIGGRLMVAGMVGEVEKVEEVKLWEVKGELAVESELGYWCEELAAMPKEMMVKIMGEGGGSIVVNWIGNYVYFQNRWEAEEIVVCEVGSGGSCEWESVRNVTASDVNRMQRTVFSGAHVGLEDLKKAIKKNCLFVEKVV
ncbi:F-box/kelch-repeat protein At1g23390-like [Vigna unguiculata]|uniref:F-box/kelch-repeat protein At1g23390-like n=1 Tax=Vigna unguiculata TaxID=3917 RepID=UPI00101651D4|nr:F-box/kelch-repeat protein At1g23390-like [Vigna unguiculata]